MRVIPDPNGYLVEVIVLKELEDLPRPERATVGPASYGNEMQLPMIRRGVLIAAAASVVLGGLGACAPTINVKVEPINIYAKLDADVRIRLDKEVQSAIQQNPNLF